MSASNSRRNQMRRELNYRRSYYASSKMNSCIEQTLGTLTPARFRLQLAASVEHHRPPAVVAPAHYILPRRAAGEML